MPELDYGLFGGMFTRGADTSDVAWLQAMLDVEAALARALERAGLAPVGSGAEVTRAATAAGFDVGELGRLCALTGNPVPGLASLLARRVSGTAARAVHRGATSQDIIDTAAMLLARQALETTGSDLRRAADSAASLAGEHRASLMIGRTLLQPAVPVTFGVVAAGWLAGLDAAIDGLTSARQDRLAVQFGGAAGTLASLGADGTRVKALLAHELSLADPPLPWHTERLRIIDVATAMARVTAALGKIARDITLLAQAEVAEVSDHSQAAPDARNPIAAVAILGCARQVPGLLATVVASAEQEHQRAAGAWHAEWRPFCDIAALASSAAAWGADLLGGLHVAAGRMAANLAAAGGLPLAERVSALLATIVGGPRAHDLVTTAAARARASGLPLRDVLLTTPELEERLKDAGITAGHIDAALDPAGYLGSAAEFITAALHAHADTKDRPLCEHLYPRRTECAGARCRVRWKRTHWSDMAEIVSLAEAVRRAVGDGDTVAMEGFTHLIPFAAGHEVIRQGRRDLTLIRMTPDLIYDQMIGAGCARKLIFSWGGNPGVGSLHRFRDAVEHGWPHPLEIEEHSHAGMANRYVAGAAGLPFAVLRGYNGTGLVAQTDTIRQITCPFTGERLTAVAAVNPDVAIIHAQRADASGNVQLWGITGVQKEAVLSAKRSVVTVEEIVGSLDPRPNSVVLPAWTVSYVAHAPNGAHPSYALDYSVRDNDYYVAWDAIARDRETFGRWLQEHVLMTAGSPA